MSMTEPTSETPAPAKSAKKRHARANKRPVEQTSEFAGLTVSDCPEKCSAKGCVISGVGICAHPHKGGLQAMLQNPASMRRLNEAKRILGKQKIDLRG
jgi:hypothetical protein